MSNTPTSVRLPQKLEKKLASVANKHGYDCSELIRIALHKLLEDCPTPEMLAEANYAYRAAILANGRRA